MYLIAIIIIIILIIFSFITFNKLLGIGGILLLILLLIIFFYQKKKKQSYINDSTDTKLKIIGMDNQPHAWILLIKLGADSEKINCTHDSKNKTYSCSYLYADSKTQGLQLVSQYKIDEQNENNPVYQFYTLCMNNNYITWNDAGGHALKDNLSPDKNCPSGLSSNGWAHDKGGIVWNKTSGIYCQSSNPHWGNFTDGFTPKDKVSGIQTAFAQHFLFVSLNDLTLVNEMVPLINRANVCIMDGAIKGFKPCIVDKDPLNCNEYKTLVISKTISIIAKPRMTVDYDVWEYLRTTYCVNNPQMYVLSFCSPTCPTGTKNDSSTPNIIDVVNTHKKKPSVLNTNCSDLTFKNFRDNHTKIGICASNIVIIGGNNHSTHTQGLRGGLFVKIISSDLFNSLYCLFK